MRIVSCTRAEADAKLANIADSCLGSESFTAEAVAALVDLADGFASVQVGHTIYVIKQEAQAS